MEWFGPEGPFAPLCEHYARTDTPVGELCAWCDEPIASDDTGVTMPHFDELGPRRLPWHSACEMRSAVGGYNHLRGSCTCCGGTEPPDPPDMSRREAALWACVYWYRQWGS